MTALDDVLKELSGPGRATFLARLVKEVSLAGRGLYPATGTSVERSAEGLLGINEAIQVVGTQLLADATGRGGYPDRAFMDELLHRANYGNARAEVLYAIQRALGAR